MDRKKRKHVLCVAMYTFETLFMAYKNYLNFTEFVLIAINF